MSQYNLNRTVRNLLDMNKVAGQRRYQEKLRKYHSIEGLHSRDKDTPVISEEQIRKVRQQIREQHIQDEVKRKIRTVFLLLVSLGLTVLVIYFIWYEIFGT